MVQAEQHRSPAQSGSRGAAVLVDVDARFTPLIEALLRGVGLVPVCVSETSAALDSFREHRPWLVCAGDTPSGREAARRVREETTTFTPIIFVGTGEDPAALTRCLEAGGNDLLTLPDDVSVLRARLGVWQRIAAVWQGIEQERDSLRLHYQLLRDEEEVAQSIFARAVAADNYASPRIRSYLRAAELFNGDFLLSAERPAGGLNLLLGDFTGHGLIAGLGAYPVSQIFRAMTEKGFATADILREINRKLHRLLPVGRFMAACFISLDETGTQAEIWNAGMPDVLLFSSLAYRIKGRFPSRHLPLGIRSTLEDEAVAERCALRPNDRLLAYSDGLIEAVDEHGEAFGQARLEQRVCSLAGNGQELIDGLIGELDRFCGEQPPGDDISVLQLLCGPMPALVPECAGEPALPPGSLDTGCWRSTLELDAAMLREIDPLPLVLDQARVLRWPQSQRSSLATVLAELYANALDHGVLGLSAELKQGPDGLERYFRERAARLERLTEGKVRIELRRIVHGADAELVLCVEDSGCGFEHESWRGRPVLDRAAAGRGIALSRALCRSVEYSAQGNRVVAVFPT